MPIVTSAIYFDREQPDGRRKIAYFMTDSLGEDHIVHDGIRKPNFDEQQGLTRAVNQKNNDLAAQESEEAINRVRQGEDALFVANDWHHGSFQRNCKKLHRWAFREESLYPMLDIEPLVEDVKATYTGDAAGRRDFLGFNVTQMQNFNQKYNATINSKDDLIAADIQEDVE